MSATLEFILFCGMIFAWSGLVTLFALKLKSNKSSPKAIDAPSVSA